MHVTTVPGSDPRRDAHVARLAEQGACVHPDPTRRGVLWNHLTVLDCIHATPSHSGWALTVQDDALPLPGWRDHLAQVMLTAPSDFVSLGHLSQHGLALQKRGIPYGEGVNATWGYAMLYRTTPTSEFESYRALAHQVYEMNPIRYRTMDDGLTAVFNLMHGTTSCFTSRSLFEHQDWGSTMGHLAGRHRRARCTIVTHPGPRWDAVPRSVKAGPAPTPVQLRAVADLWSFTRV